jgi:hypothetical protein
MQLVDKGSFTLGSGAELLHVLLTASTSFVILGHAGLASILQAILGVLPLPVGTKRKPLLTLAAFLIPLALDLRSHFGRLRCRVDRILR